MNKLTSLTLTALLLAPLAGLHAADTAGGQASAMVQPLPKIRVATDGRTFVTETGKPIVPFGVN